MRSLVEAPANRQVINDIIFCFTVFFIGPAFYLERTKRFENNLSRRHLRAKGINPTNSKDR